MAESDGLNEIEKGLFQWAVVTNVISPTQFQATRFQDGRSAYADGFFTGWTVYVLRDIRSAPTVVAAPQGEQVVATAFVQRGGIVTHPAFTTPMMAGDEILMIHPNIGAGVGAAIATVTALLNRAQGLCYYGVVTGVPVAGQFEIATLVGLGASKFATVVPEYQYHAFVLRDASGPGAAPQGESRPVTNYATLTGNFTANAFTIPVGIGDEILIIHPYLARVMNLYGLPPVVGTVADTWSTGFATSGLAGGDLVTLGAALARYKLHSLLVNISALTPGALITVRMFMLVTGAERMVYQQTFTQGVDPNGLWIVNGTLAIHEALRVEVYSNIAGDDGRNIDYDYMLEAM